MMMQIEIVINETNQEMIPEKLRREYELELGDVVMLERSEDEETGQYSYRVLERIRPEFKDTDWRLLIPESLIEEFDLGDGVYVLNENGKLILANFDDFVDAIPRQVFETCEAIGLDTDEFLELLRECRLPYENISHT